MSNAAHNLPARPWPWWHLLGLWAIVVAQPLLDVLRQNGDFFVAHRASPTDLVLFVFLLLVAVPAMIGLAIRALALVWVPLSRAAQVCAVGVLLAAMASQIVQRAVDLPTWPHVFVAGALAALGAWAYAGSPGVRWCASALAVAVPVFGVMFLMHPSMDAFVNPMDRTAPFAAEVRGGSPPVVVVVFDQLPVASLLAPDGTIDARHYPGFAALARESTWFRNATANAEFTGWALPAIMTGRMPRPARLPISQHHPQSLFSVLGEAYHFKVTEPITRLCPDRLCPPDDGALWERTASMLSDSSVVYAHIVAPAEVRAHLPALTDDWRDFVQGDHWQRRWVRARDHDRTEPVERFIQSISASDPQPTMYFLHVLLPHEPYVYLRSGQHFATQPRNMGLSRERWSRDAYLAAVGQARHLTQLEYVDGVVERLVARLRAQGLYDRSVLVVTSDHGASFRAGHPWKGLNGTNASDIMGVPLFIKAPGQPAGATDTRNAQAIDVLPTVLEMLRVSPREPVDGHSMVGRPVPETRKTIRYSGASREAIVETADHERRLLESVARRWATLADGVRPVPDEVPRGLLDTPVSPDAPASSLTVLLEGPQRFANVDVSGPLVPLYLEGRVVDAEGKAAAARLAVAVDGVVRALARTAVDESDTQAGTWSALLPRSSLHEGRNLVQVYALEHDGRPEIAFSSGERPESLNLSSNAAAQFWGVTIVDFHPRERRSVPAFRWTSSTKATLVIPLDIEPRPQSLRISLVGPPPAGGAVRIALAGCVLHDGPIVGSPWRRVFSLAACPAVAAAHEARLTFESATVTKDGREVGLAVESVTTLSSSWPPTSVSTGGWRGAITLPDGRPVTARATPVQVQVRNTGTGLWSDTSGQAPVAIALSWRRVSTGQTDSTQRLRLSDVLFPGDRLRMEVPLVPPPSVDGPGRWEVTLSLVTLDGVAVPVDSVPTLSVSASQR